MKHLFLAAALLGATATATLAQGLFPPPPTEAESQSGKQNMVAKTNELELNLKAHKVNKAEDAAAQILKMMKNRVAQTRYMAEAQTGTQKETIMKRMLMLENRVLTFRDAAKDVSKNGTELLAQARTFTNDY